MKLKTTIAIRGMAFRVYEDKGHITRPRSKN